ncbi:hypothetical protein KFL_000160250 [Klebsormidium nitens]|uniref:EGF-like domain-containing protein n=1 Tax=Klebsormidium nitens TaxID=105231 RepID=A0A1Y1HLS9_KLENI|nr:hypothetical protein KFL_000160250 [Klebsormidium nitens]|eukprot:GAQ78622.1 hypothetical protein KFL_000160250 [Klebsormidium nitens]
MASWRVCLLGLICSLFMVAIVQAGSSSFTDCNTLKALLATAQDHDTLIFNGNISITTQACSTGLPIVIDKSIQIVVNGAGGSQLPSDNAFDGRGATNTASLFKITNGAKVDFVNVGFQNVKSSANGAAVSVDSNSQVTFTNYVFKWLESTAQGGAVYLGTSATAIFTVGTMQFNKAANGGAIYAEMNSKLTIVTSFLTNNHASVNGGALVVWGDATVTACTIDANTADVNGAAYSQGGSGLAFFTSTAITRNVAGARAAIHVFGGNAYFKSGTYMPVNSDPTGLGAPDGSADYFGEAPGFASFCPMPNDPVNLNPHTLAGPYAASCPGVTGTITDCCALGAAIAGAAKGATLTVSGIVQLTADQCSPCNVQLPIHISQDITVNGADLNPDYNVITGRTVFGAGAFVVDENVTASFNRISFREFSLNTTFANGAIFYVKKGAFLFTNLCNFLNSKSFHGNGGAIYMEKDTYLLAYADTFRFNWALNGGAIYAEVGSIIQAFTSTIEKNWAKENGAGLFHKGSMLGDYTTFNGNQAGRFGGAVDNNGGTAIYFGGQFGNNTAMCSGGALYLDEGGQVQARFNVFITNDIDASVTPPSGCTPDLASGDARVVNTDPQTYLWACPPQEDQFGDVIFEVSPNTTAAWNTTCPILTGQGEYIKNCSALVAALKAAAPGDTILIGSTDTALNGWSNSGTYIEMSPEICGASLPLVIDKSITIRGAADQALYNVFTTHSKYPMFMVRQNGFTPVKVILESLTFMEAATAGDGAAVYQDVFTDVTYSNMYFTQNIARNGGAVFLGQGATATFQVGSITRNTATGNGGGIYTSEGSTVHFRSYSIQGNRAVQDGGGAFLKGDSDYQVFTYGSNRAGGVGGAFKLVGPVVANFIATGALLSNQAGVAGGAIWVDDCARVLLQTTFVYSNKVADSGDRASDSVFTQPAGFTQLCRVPNITFTDPTENFKGPHSFECANGTLFAALAWPNYVNGICNFTAPVPGGGQFGVNGTAPAPAPAVGPAPGVSNPSCDVDVCFPGTCRLYENGNKCRCPKGFARQTKAPGPFGERREVCVPAAADPCAAREGPCKPGICHATSTTTYTCDCPAPDFVSVYKRELAGPECERIFCQGVPYKGPQYHSPLFRRGQDPKLEL